MIYLDEQIFEHPKFVAAGAKACWLWLCGIGYCRRHLTDGLIPRAALAIIAATLQPRDRTSTAARLVEARLWDIHPDGWMTHDYLHWNRSREEILTKREKDAKRKRGVRAASGMESGVESPSFPRVPYSLSPNPVQQSKEHSVGAIAENGDAPRFVQTLFEPPEPQDVLKPKTPPPNPEVKLFLEWFQTEYTKRRHGAVYTVKWPKESKLVKELLHAHSFERLKTLAAIMLSDKCGEEWIIDTDRGIGILSAKINWLEDRLATWEAERNGKK